MSRNTLLFSLENKLFFLLNTKEAPKQKERRKSKEGLGPSEVALSSIFWRAPMYWNPINSTQLPENQKPPQTQKLRNSNSETQKLQLRNSESPSFRVSEAEFPCRTISGSFGVGTKSPKHYVYRGPTHFGSFRADFFGQNRATQKLRLKNSKTQTQKLVFRVSESDFLSFRVRLSEFLKLRGFRAVRVRVDSNTLGPLNLYCYRLFASSSCCLFSLRLVFSWSYVSFASPFSFFPDIFSSSVSCYSSMLSTSHVLIFLVLWHLCPNFPCSLSYFPTSSSFSYSPSLSCCLCTHPT